MYYDFLNVAALAIGGIVFVYANMVFFSLIRPNKPNELKLSSYECGIEVFGSAWVRFDMRYYSVALIFLIFDLEIAFLFPWSVVFKELGAIARVEGLIFVLILFLGLAYVWAKGDLDWVKSYTKGHEIRLGDTPADEARRLAGAVRPEPAAPEAVAEAGPEGRGA
ncbi:MAG: NADH-quinone oxidoreductase subunit A [Planctomycetota bacterium]